MSSRPMPAEVTSCGTCHTAAHIIRGKRIPTPLDTNWHRATPRAAGMATPLAITPRDKEGQVRYSQPDAQGGDNQ